MKTNWAGLVAGLILVWGETSLVHAGCAELPQLIRQGGYALADENGAIVESCNEEMTLLPASILKIPTALAALHLLGPAYRFSTQFYLDKAGNLYVKGYGDPMLTSEEVALIVQRLREKKVTRINDIVIDDSAFAPNMRMPGQGASDNPYDAPIGAVAVNFNTVAIRVDRQGRVESAEAQTPTLPLMRELGKRRRPGTYRLNVGAGGSRNTVTRYSAELLRALQRRAGIAGEGRLTRGRVVAGARLIYTHRSSRDLSEVIAFMLKYSSNFSANQLFLTCGAKVAGYPADLPKARRVMASTLNELLGHEIAGELHLDEGSGLSRNNRVTPRAMIEVLRKFQPHAELLPQRHALPVKSGTLRNVFTYAGYLDEGQPFVIILNQPGNGRDAVLAHLRAARLRESRRAAQ